MHRRLERLAIVRAALRQFVVSLGNLCRTTYGAATRRTPEQQGWVPVPRVTWRDRFTKAALVTTHERGDEVRCVYVVGGVFLMDGPWTHMRRRDFDSMERVS